MEQCRLPRRKSSNAIWHVCGPALSGTLAPRKNQQKRKGHSPSAFVVGPRPTAPRAESGPFRVLTASTDQESSIGKRSVSTRHLQFSNCTAPTVTQRSISGYAAWTTLLHMRRARSRSSCRIVYTAESTVLAGKITPPDCPLPACHFALACQKM